MALRIGLRDFAEGDVGLLQSLLQALDGAVGLGVDGVIDLHLENQVRAALKVEAEVNARLHGSQ